MNYKLVIVAVLAAAVLVFLVQNTAVVDLRFLFWTASLSRALLIIILVGTGILIGWLLRGYARRRVTSGARERAQRTDS